MNIDPLGVDLYVGDGQKDYRAFCAAGYPWCFVIWKASQGGRYRYDTYVKHERAAFLAAAGERYGSDLFDGFYDFLDLSVSGTVQCDFFMKVVESLGGEKIGTLWGMVDVERGGQSIQNPSKSVVEDRTSEWAARYTTLTGRQATLYGGELLRSVGVTTRLGCGRSAIALYGNVLPASVVARTGTDLEHLFLWQYVGAETTPRTGPAGYPREAPGCGRVDISAMVLPGGLPHLRAELLTKASGLDSVGSLSIPKAA